MKELLGQLEAGVCHPSGAAPPEELRRHERERAQLSPQVADLEKSIARLEAGLAVLLKAEGFSSQEEVLARRTGVCFKRETFAELVNQRILAAEDAAEAAFFAGRVSYARLACVLVAGCLLLSGIVWYWLFQYLPWARELTSGDFPRQASWVFRVNLLATLVVFLLCVPMISLSSAYVLSFFRNKPSLKPAEPTLRGCTHGAAASIIGTSCLLMLLSSIPYCLWAFPVLLSGVVSRPPTFLARLITEYGTFVVSLWCWAFLWGLLGPLRLLIAHVRLLIAHARNRR